jgi:hypothetical protein
MNKAFVKEPEFDGRAFCPRCGNLGHPVEAGPLDTYVRPESRGRMHDSAWFCGFPRCDVAYFNLFDAVVMTDELKRSVYPKDPNAPICACFGFRYDDVERDADAPTPTRIRELFAKSKTAEANCHTLAADGRPCITAIQELYMKLRAPPKPP